MNHTHDRSPIARLPRPAQPASAKAHQPRSLEAIAPFRRSPESTAPIATNVRGEVPPWLRGVLVRTGPAVFECGAWRAEHWFDGLAMLYAFEIDGAASITFRSRHLDSQAARDASAGKTRVATFATPMARSLVQRLFSPIPRITDNANVNVVQLGDDLVAMTEGDRQTVVDPVTLAARGIVEYEDRFSGLIMSAHPHFDFERNRLVNVATKLGATGVLSVYEHAPSERRRTMVGSWHERDVPEVHSFGLTPRNAVLIAHPLVYKPTKMLWSNRGILDHWRWRPENGTKLIVIDRSTGAVREHIADAFIGLHTVNAFERDGETVLDVLTQPNPDIFNALRIENMIERLPDLRSTLLRVRMRPGTASARVETLSDVRFEYPQTSYRRVNGHDYRFVWGAAITPRSGGGYTSSIVKLDVLTGACTSYGNGTHVFGEPVFVAHPNATNEDEGVLVTVGSREDADTSMLAILDATTMELVASAEVARAIPLSFHGSFIDRGTPRADPEGSRRHTRSP